MISPPRMSLGSFGGITDIVPGTDNVTVDIIDGVATIGVTETGSPARVFNNPSRSLDNVFQISTTRDAAVQYSVLVQVSAPDISGSHARVYLEYANDAAMSSGHTYVAQADVSISGVADITLAAPGNVGGIIPAGKWVRIRSSDIVGAPFYAVTIAQEVLL